MTSQPRKQIELRYEKVSESTTICTVESSNVNGFLTFDTTSNKYTYNLTSLKAHETATFENIPALIKAVGYFIMTQMTDSTVVPPCLVHLLE